MNHNSNFLLLGPENGEKLLFIQSLRKSLTKRWGQAPEEYKFYPFETNITELVALLQNESLFSPHKLVLLNNSEAIKNSREIDTLTHYLKSPNPHSTLLCLSNEIQVNKKIEAAIPKANKKIFWELFESQKRSWIISFFKKQHKEIEKDAIDFLLEMVENNTQDLKKVCENLILFFHAEESLNQEKIESYIYHSKEENVFTLFHKMAAADLPGSMETLQKILLSGDSNQGIQLLAGLLWQFRRLKSLKFLLDNQYNLREAFQKLKIKSKKNQAIYITGKDHYNSKELKKIIVLMEQYGSLLRNSRAELNPLLLSMFVYTCVVKKGEGVINATTG